MNDLRSRVKLAETEIIESTGKEDDNVVDLIAVTGGKGPPTYHPNDWLSPLETGTVFLIKDNFDQNQFSLGQCKILAKEEPAIYIGFVINGATAQGPVDPARFCKRYSLYKVTGVAKEAGEEQEETVGETDERDRVQGEPGGQTGAVEKHD